MISSLKYHNEKIDRLEKENKRLKKKLESLSENLQELREELLIPKMKKDRPKTQY